MQLGNWLLHIFASSEVQLNCLWPCFRHLVILGSSLLHSMPYVWLPQRCKHSGLWWVSESYLKVYHRNKIIVPEGRWSAEYNISSLLCHNKLFLWFWRIQLFISFMAVSDALQIEFKTFPQRNCDARRKNKDISRKEVSKIFKSFQLRILRVIQYLWFPSSNKKVSY